MIGTWSQDRNSNKIQSGNVREYMQMLILEQPTLMSCEKRNVRKCDETTVLLFT